MDIVLAIFAVICLLAGLAGCVVPFLPGPPVSYVGLLLIRFSGFGGLSARFLWIWAAITAAVTVLDIVLPARMARRRGGSRGAVTGTWVGMAAGLFFPPVGIIVLPFLGALVGELIAGRGTGKAAFKAAAGAFAGFMAGTGLKLIACFVMLFYGIRAFFT